MLKCPKCGKEMELGWINAWTTAGAYLGTRVTLSWIDIDVIRSKFALRRAEIFLSAHKCSNCQLIVSSYAEKEKNESPK